MSLAEINGADRMTGIEFAKSLKAETGLSLQKLFCPTMGSFQLWQWISYSPRPLSDDQPRRRFLT